MRRGVQIDEQARWGLPVGGGVEVVQHGGQIDARAARFDAQPRNIEPTDAALIAQGRVELGQRQGVIDGSRQVEPLSRFHGQAQLGNAEYIFRTVISPVDG